MTSRRRVSLKMSLEALQLSAPFVITGYTFTEMMVVVARLNDGAATGEGEAAGVYYLGDNDPQMSAGIESVRKEIEAGANREELRKLLPPCGARNALDCAMWDLEAKRSGRPAWSLAGLEPPHRLTTTFTIGAGEPGVMAGKATRYSQARALKLKLTGQVALDAERVHAVRKARPEVWLGVDANQGFTPDTLEELMPTLVTSAVKLVEQPFARGREADLDDFESPIPVAADESVQGIADVESLVGRFDVVNIKLDKCGGLTEGLAMAAEVRRLGMNVMVGNMVGTSLAMAPAFLVGQLCDIVDLDGPIFITRDRTPAISYDQGFAFYPDKGWGSAG